MVSITVVTPLACSILLSIASARLTVSLLNIPARSRMVAPSAVAGAATKAAASMTGTASNHRKLVMGF